MSAFIPIASASKVSELTFRSGAAILGKEAIGEAAGWAGSEVTGLFTDNEQVKMLAGMASSMAAGGMSNKIDNYFNLSGNFPDVKLSVNETFNNTDNLKHIQTGGREFDVNEYIKKLEKVDERYEKIRNNNNDVFIISENTGISESKIQRIKDHLFIKEHIKDEGIGRFDSDVEIADAWDRLISGNYNSNDLDLLNHEYYESRFESIFKTDYRTAHDSTITSGRIWDPFKEVE